MLADLDLLLTAVFCAADDLLPKRAKNARRRITDAEVVTLCIARRCSGSRPTNGSWPSPPSASGTALAAAVALNHRLGRPSRSLACYTA